MLFVVVRSLDEVPDGCDGVEVRVDLLDRIDFAKIDHFIMVCPVPVMLTLRSKKHGGAFTGNREAIIWKMAGLGPAFLDLEYDLDPAFISEIMDDFSHLKFVISCHVFKKIGMEGVDELYRQMAIYPACTYKIAIQLDSANEALAHLLFARTLPKISLICMGERGAFARVLGAVNGNVINYAALGEGGKTDPGQITLSDFVAIYRYKNLSGATQVYGLIGNPTKNSLGHIYHNRRFSEEGKDAVYVKMDLEIGEMETFLLLANRFGFKGVSVTMPLKEVVASFLGERGSVNTLLFTGSRVVGANTDGIAALDAIEEKMPVEGKRLAILGTGGAAKGIAQEAAFRGADLLIFGRDGEKARKLAAQFGGHGGNFSEMEAPFDILVNALPAGIVPEGVTIPFPVLVMDVNYNPKETHLLKAALIRGCSVICGDRMFELQAEAQRALWFSLPFG